MRVQIVKLLLGALMLLVASIQVSAANLSNTPECRKYASFARGAGAAETYGPLIQLYNACLNSAKRRPDVKQYKCAPRTYRHKYNGKWVCAAGKGLPPDNVVGPNGKTFGSFRKKCQGENGKPIQIKSKWYCQSVNESKLFSKKQMETCCAAYHWDACHKYPNATSTPKCNSTEINQHCRKNTKKGRGSYCSLPPN